MDRTFLAYYEDGQDLVTMAMNGWGDPEPAWWLNLQAHPETSVELKDGRRAVRGRRGHVDGVRARPQPLGRGGVGSVHDASNVRAVRRVIDHDPSASMEKKKQEGYF